MTTTAEAADAKPDAVEILQRAFLLELPVVAVFGQAAGWSKKEPDPVLGLALERLGRTGDSWAALLTREPLQTEFYDWLSERLRRRAPTAQWEQITDAPLSAVFTSSIDPGLLSLFSTNGRQPEPVIVGEPRPIVARSRRRPPIYYLFGRADSGIAEGRPPMASADLTRRRARHANSMLHEIGEAATAIGTVVIDGIDFQSDWLRAEDLLAQLVGTPIGSIVWCGPEPVLDDSDADLYETLRRSGVLVRDDRSFAQLLALARASGAWPDEERWDEPEVITLTGRQQIVTTPKLRLATQASAIILDDSWTGFLPPLSPAVDKSAFHSFHAVPSTFRSLAEGVRRDFAIARDFETELSSRVRRALARPHDEQTALILHGQSGVGKTIALARLALQIRQERLAAVLFCAERFPQPTDVSEFLAVVDKADSTALLIVDGDLGVHRYDELLRALKSRGHRVVVLGSSYRIERQSRVNEGRYVEAPALLTRTEQDQLIALAGKYAPEASAKVAAHAASEHALVRFYWDLPASRGRLAAGLGKEARSVERELRIRGPRQQAETPLGDLGRALVAAGFDTPSRPIMASEQESLLGNTAADKIIDYVMVASRLYQPVPVNLVLRAVSGADQRLDLSLLHQLFEGFDLFRWRFADEEGRDLLISSRLQIEAQVICDRRLGGALAEARRIAELIGYAYRASEEGGEEARFLADVVFSLGPDGPFGDRYRDAYAEVARALTRLRTARGVTNPRLMLQESVLRRSYVRNPGITPEDKAELLDEATRAIDAALEATEGTGVRRVYASRRTRDNLWVERAATYSFLATDSAQRNLDVSEVWSSYLAAREAVRHATGRVDTYFPLDTGLWLPADILRQAQNLTLSQQAELRADIQSTLDRVEPETLEAAQFERFQQRRVRLADVLGDTSLSDEALQSLDAIGSAAGYYLRARRLMPERDATTEVVDESALRSATAAAAFLQASYAKVSADPRCMYLLLSAEWLKATRRWLFSGLRQPLPTLSEDQARIRRALIDLSAASKEQLAPRYRYLEAVMDWLVGDEASSIASWRTLARDTEYVESSRVLSRHILADESGKPKLFDGVVARQIGENRWSLYVAALSRSVDFVGSQLDGHPIAVGRTIREFGVAFNYIGPIADAHLRRAK